jgi:hypothetical protein
VVSDEGKGALEASGGDQEGERKRIADEVSKPYVGDIKTGVTLALRDESRPPDIGAEVAARF